MTSISSVLPLLNVTSPVTFNVPIDKPGAISPSLRSPLGATKVPFPRKAPVELFVKLPPVPLNDAPLLRLMVPSLVKADSTSTCPTSTLSVPLLSPVTVLSKRKLLAANAPVISSVPSFWSVPPPIMDKSPAAPILIEFTEALSSNKVPDESITFVLTPDDTVNPVNTVIFPMPPN